LEIGFVPVSHTAEQLLFVTLVSLPPPTHSKAHLAPYLPSHPITHIDDVQCDKRLGTVSSAARGSAAVLPISWAYMMMIGPKGLKRASEVSSESLGFAVTMVMELNVIIRVALMIS
jgi:glycine dehydrogenase